jgi:beta-lactamase superfamily II metal-dependent hydrolase
MVFSLEALRARHGDSLIVHFGDPDEPRTIVIDGGPSGVFKKALLPRLEELRGERGGKLEVEILMVSHLDDDHVKGILELAEAVDEDGELRGGFGVGTLWLNAFEDAVGDGAPVQAGAASVPAGLESGDLTAVVATVGEGRGLRDLARKLHWEQNAGFDKLVVVPDDSGVEVDLDLDPLKLTVIGPRAAELEQLRDEWVKELDKLREKEKTKGKVAEYLDQSVYNLSSIVCLAELGGKRMLLTGDARGDKILLGLEAAGLLGKDEPMKVDLLKVPHHGSSRNLKQEFFERILAKEIVISADGEYGNPDMPTLEMISAARKDDDFTLHLTYGDASEESEDFKVEVRKPIHDFFASETKGGRKYRVAFRPAADLSLRVDLLDAPA